MASKVTADAKQLDVAVQRMGLRLHNRAGAAFVGEVRKNASRRTGEMARKTTVTPARLVGNRVVSNATVGVDYGRYQDEGTGEFGPEHKRITPRRAKVLRFDSAIFGIVFARSVRGSEPTRFWTKAVKSWPQIVRRIAAGG